MFKLDFLDVYRQIKTISYFFSSQMERYFLENNYRNRLFKMVFKGGEIFLSFLHMRYGYWFKNEATWPDPL